MLILCFPHYFYQCLETLIERNTCIYCVNLIYYLKGLDLKRNAINNFYLHTNLKIVSTDDVDLFKNSADIMTSLKILDFFTERYAGNPSLLDISIGFLLDWSQVSSCCEI